MMVLGIPVTYVANFLHKTIIFPLILEAYMRGGFFHVKSVACMQNHRELSEIIRIINIKTIEKLSMR